MAEDWIPEQYCEHNAHTFRSRWCKSSVSFTPEYTETYGEGLREADTTTMVIDTADKCGSARNGDCPEDQFLFTG
eukprot:CAMPEP_0204329878 /NCGR_PEP_ID=MMETSP0469-20131031/14499_1 /ASSEMBLY_ACC=CAM_ASM_000384 /TAXON_ID=2969 /ORGANISM="Oxyrrhis marina" /LENGTH=74 /DNA_ID=CAMNT_0051312569 /DNA_START=26 /DNA_END=247 /DNA_ORIENTATION=+